MNEVRKEWLSAMKKIVLPVLEAAASGTIKRDMPIRGSAVEGKDKCTHLEALGRTVCGIAPWLEAENVSANERDLQKRCRELAVTAICRAVDPGDEAFLNFNDGGQPLVDAAFLAQGLLRAPRELLGSMNEAQLKNIAAAMKSTRVIKPCDNNWILFSAMIETLLYKTGFEYDMKPVEYALRKFDGWYLGDGVYGDGEYFSWDYYNSFVIQPMLVDISSAFGDERYDIYLSRMKRYADHLERMIMPDGSYPVIGRSSAYRFGAFHALAQCALMNELPDTLTPGSVRRAMTAVLKRTMCDEIFDKDGWLLPGITGNQPGMGEGYISTGSLYLCAFFFLPLGLEESSPFWSEKELPFTQEKIWSGMDVPCDHSVN